MLNVELHLPRVLSFGGSKLVLSPGKNAVDEGLFMELWASDGTIKWYFEEGAFSVEKGNEPWAPNGAAKAAKKPPAETVHAVVPTSELRSPEDKPEPGPPPPNDPIEPTRVGGGVPGSAAESKALISATDDPAMLKDWLSNDNRATVRRAIKTRIENIEG